MINLKIAIRNYDALIIDIWGVIYDGIDPYKDVIETVNIIIKEKKKKIIFLSNTPRPSHITYLKLKELGIMLEENDVYTSGDAVREQLLIWNDEIFKNLGKNIYYLGAEKNHDILSNINVKEVKNIELADFILLTAYLDQGEDLSQYDEILLKAKSRNLPLICANPDKEVVHGKQIRYCAGTFAERYIKIGGSCHYYGKPDNKVYKKVIEKLNIDKSKILMIGDTLETDIKGAYNAGIDSLLVLTGNGQQSKKNITTIKPKWISESLSFNIKSHAI